MGVENEGSRRVKTEFLVQMDGMGSGKGNVLFMAATNLPWVLDPAVRRRFEKRVYVPLPTWEDRVKMLETKLKDNVHTLTKENIISLASLTEHFSGSDISILVREAAFEPLRHCLRATHFIVEPKRSTPCAPSNPRGVEMDIYQIDPVTLHLPPIDYDDFMSALIICKPTVNKVDLDRYTQWTE